MFEFFIAAVIDQMFWIEDAQDTACALPYRTWFNVCDNVVTLGWQLSMDFC